MDVKKFEKHYSKDEFWRKLRELPDTAGDIAIRNAITLYVLLTEKGVPWWLKASILAALGYFVCPIDAIPDFLPGGFVDDIVVMCAVVAEASSCVTTSVRLRVNDLLAKVGRAAPRGEDRHDKAG
jgi:uncharacterized membrane protein YkvA (DUF1232 family)